MVFSPHPDDEILGCGGTICQRTRAGAELALVLLTDGSQSHPKLLDPPKMAILRRQEACLAAAAVGVAAENTLFLGYPDQSLRECEQDAIISVGDILRRRRPQDVFVPSRHEMPSDHQAANRIVRAAVRNLGYPVAIYEFPVWLWSLWPWVPAQPSTSRLHCSGLRHVISVVDALSQKRQALSKYATQLTRWNGSDDWAALGDVADGEFLDNFFQPFELFACRPGSG